MEHLNCLSGHDVFVCRLENIVDLSSSQNAEVFEARWSHLTVDLEKGRGNVYTSLDKFYCCLTKLTTAWWCALYWLPSLCETVLTYAFKFCFSLFSFSFKQLFKHHIHVIARRLSVISTNTDELLFINNISACLIIYL